MDKNPTDVAEVIAKEISKWSALKASREIWDGDSKKPIINFR